MSDAAFRTAKYPSYTTAELRQMLAASKGGNVRGVTEDHRYEMADEIDRRAKVEAGDVSAMTDGGPLVCGRIGLAAYHFHSFILRRTSDTSRYADSFRAAVIGHGPILGSSGKPKRFRTEEAAAREAIKVWRKMQEKKT